MLQIPVSNDPKSQYFVQVYDSRTQSNDDAINLQIVTYFNTMASMWYLGLYNSSGIAYANGLAKVPNINITRSLFTLPENFGQLRVFDTNGEGNSALNTLGISSFLVYYAQGEFEELYPNSPSVNGLAPVGLN